MGKYYTKNTEYLRKETNNKEVSMNKVIIMGRVGSEIETKNIGGNYMARFNLATSERWKNKAGEKQEKTSWHNVTAWGNIAKAVAQYSVKGKRLLVEGKIDYRTWDKEDGSKGYATGIIANNISIVDFAEKEERQEPQSQQPEFDASDIPF